MARSRFPVWLMAAMLVLVTIVLYWPAMRYGFINFDDPDNITANPHVQGGLNWEGVKWAFRNTEQHAYWAPLMWLSHQLAWQLFGSNAWGHHLINVLLHAINTALVFLVFRRMTRATGRSLVLAALFGLHPLRVESVAWVTERKDVLSTLFWMLTLWTYAKYVEAAQVRNSKSNHWYGAALAMFVLGLMSKPMLVTVPCVLLLLDYWPLGRFEPSTLNSDQSRASSQLSTIGKLVTEKIPFFALAAAASVVTFVVQKQGGAVIAIQNLPLGARVGNALISYCRYLGKLFWLTDLAVFYPHPGYWPMAQVFLAGGLIVGTSLLLFVKRRRYPFLLMGWLWFCGTLVPVIGLAQSGEQAMADRFTYVPSLGVLILAIWGAYELTRRWRYQEIALSVAGSAAIVLCLALTRQQLGYWKDSETLFQHALEVTKNNYFAHKALGDALLKKDQIDEAIRQFQEAIRLKPDDADVHYNLGNALLKKDQTDEAIRQFQEVIRLKPDDTEAHNNLGNALLKKGQTDEAIRQFQEVIRLKPDDAEVHNNLGIALRKKGQTDEAIRQYQEAIRLKPDYADAHFNLGNALLKKDQTDEAIRQYQEAIRLKPDDAEAHNNLGIALGRKGRTRDTTN
jgi:Flp pilus assembly protein TadD